MRAFVADNDLSDNSSAIHVVDLPSGGIVTSLKTRHNPDVAVSPSGDKLFVAHTDLDLPYKHPERDELLVYDAQTLELVHKAGFQWRSLYNVAPTSSSIAVSHDGTTCYVNRTECLGDDLAHNTMIAFDVAGGRFDDKLIELPYQVTSFSPVHGMTGVQYALSGRLGEAVGFGDPAADSEPRLRHDFPKGDPMLFNMAGTISHPDEAWVYVVSRAGIVQVWDVERDRFGERIYVELPRNGSIPLAHLLVTSDSLLLGAASRELAARGQSQAVLTLSTGGGSLFRESSLLLDPPAEKLALGADGTMLVTLSRLENALSVYDLRSREVVGKTALPGRHPVAFALAS